ncbi:MAG: phytanoyl-CoA dioxygenase family protein [Phycisphaeraceae bacterium]|nr:phytanoyl-CoA dioxygenase family protein [Phycisphaeraceae bacterium]
MLLTEEQIEHYYREGYVLVRGLVPPEVIAEVVRDAQAHLDNNLAEHLKHGGQRDGWQPVSFDMAQPQRNDPSLHQLLWNPDVTEAVGQILGTPPRVLYGMLAMVPPHGGNGLPWHQDAQYSHVHGGALNAFIALGRIEPEMANLWVAPRSHTLGLQPSKTNQTTAAGHREAVVEPDNGFCLPALDPGDVCIFDRLTYHRSLSNTLDRPRYAYAAQFCARHARMTATGKLPEQARMADEWAEHYQAAAK